MLRNFMGDSAKLPSNYDKRIIVAARHKDGACYPTGLAFSVFAARNVGSDLPFIYCLETSRRVRPISAHEKHDEMQQAIFLLL